MNQYEGVTSRAHPTIELTQAMLLTTNFKEAAANINNIQMNISAKKFSGISNVHAPLGSTKGTSKNVTGVSSGEKVGSAPDAVSTGASYFYKQDYMADLAKKCASKDFEQVSKLMANLGPQDKASNWLLEQR